MKTSLLSLLSFFLLASSSFTQDLIKSNFDTDSEGWLVSGGILHYKSSDGTPVGFIGFEFSGHSDESQNLSSGVYFYQLKAGEFVQTKKMVYLK